MELFRTKDFFIFVQGEHSLWWDRQTGASIPKSGEFQKLLLNCCSQHDSITCTPPLADALSIPICIVFYSFILICFLQDNLFLEVD